MRFALAIFIASAFTISAFAEDRLESLKQETTVLLKETKKFSRNKDVLILKFDNGKSRTFKDKNCNCEQALNAYVLDYIPELNLAVVKQQFYEGSEYRLIQMRDGSSISSPALPLWSPSKTKFIATLDDDSGESESKVVIGSCTKKKCSEIYSESSHSGDAKWIDEKTVEFVNRHFDPGTGQSDAKATTCTLEKKVSCSEKR